MNKIDEHAREAGITVNIQYDGVKDDMNKWVDAFAAEFAKRILTEAAEIANYMEDQNETEIGDAILKYFDVGYQDN